MKLTKLAAALAALCCMGVLAACGGGGGPSSAAPTNVPPSATIKAESGASTGGSGAALPHRKVSGGPAR